MFDGKYFEWNQKRTKAIVDHYGYKFFYGKKVADLGCGYADISGSLYRLGSEVTTVDARQEHLKIVTKKFHGIKVVKANLDGPWPFYGQKFDLILDLGLICHLASFEDHLKAVCASTTYLVLETAVCDSEDPNKVIQVPEGKDIYDLAYNGMGCRPSSAAIERVLSECGMTFKRMDSSKFNVGDYVYDWQPQNNNSTSLGKRRIWFATKTAAGIYSMTSSAQPAIVITPPVASNMGYTAPIQSSGIPIVLTASPKPPRPPPLPEPKLIDRYSINQLDNYPVNLLTNHMQLEPNALNFHIRKISKAFSIINPETYAAPNTYSTGGIILPNTISSKMWMKKIAPLFPNIRVFYKASGMFGFTKTQDTPNLAMCALGGLVPANRIWIEEWSGQSLQPGDIEVLKNCQTIMTPSLINAQEILSNIPNANVSRIEKPWPMIPVESVKTGHFLYFEKNQDITQALINSWNGAFGKLIVVGTHLSLPDFAEGILDTANYTYISSLLVGAQAVIDISDNNYYMSGILKLAQSLSLPIITNNQFYFNQSNSILIDHDKAVVPYPTNENIQKAVQSFINDSNKSTVKFDINYNDNVNDDMIKLIGA